MTTAEFKGSSLKFLEKHTQCPISYIWWFIQAFIFMVFEGKGRVGELLNHSKGHNMLEGNAF